MVPNKPTHWHPGREFVTHADLSAWAGAWGATRDAPRRALGPRDVLGSVDSPPSEEETYHG
eukprot:254425-Pyramimonas_sp.AAC.1